MGKNQRVRALAAELAEIYPDAEKRLADLLKRIEVNDREVEWVTYPTARQGSP